MEEHVKEGFTEKDSESLNWLSKVSNEENETPATYEDLPIPKSLSSYETLRVTIAENPPSQHENAIFVYYTFEHIHRKNKAHLFVSIVLEVFVKKG